MQFAIQRNLINEKDLTYIIDAVRQYKHILIDIVPFSDDLITPVPLDGCDYIPYGSTSLTVQAKKLGWRGLFLNDNFDYETAQAHRHDMLNHGINDNVMTVDEAISFLQRQESDSDWFVRPSDDLKHFSGIVLKANEIQKWFLDAKECGSSGSYKMTGEMKVVVAEPKNILAEWRYFIVNGQVITGSMYRCAGQLFRKRESDWKVLREAQYKADIWLPASSCVMDLAMVDEDLKVIEFNCINASGFYDHDIPAVFDALWKHFH